MSFKALPPDFPSKLFAPDFSLRPIYNGCNRFVRIVTPRGSNGFRYRTGMGYPRVALSPVIYFVFSSGSLTLTAITTHSESVCTRTVTSRTSGAFLTPDRAHSTPSLEPRDLWHPSHRKRTGEMFGASIRDLATHAKNSALFNLDKRIFVPFCQR